MFHDLAVYLARAIFRSEANEKDVLRRVHDLGFAAAEPMNEPVFPINSFTLLALGMFTYLAVLTVFFSHLHHAAPALGDGLLMVLKIALARLCGIGVMLWLMQQFAFFHRDPGEPHKYFAFDLCGMITGLVAAAVCLPFAVGAPGGWLSPGWPCLASWRRYLAPACHISTVPLVAPSPRDGLRCRAPTPERSPIRHASQTSRL
jgi:hypothetical protein